jgi:hypothetical protein
VVKKLANGEERHEILIDNFVLQLAFRIFAAAYA